MTPRGEQQKPLFIPLKREYFEAFKRGEKQQEFRKHGPRWNANTCTPGRPVVLSLGYGKGNRLTGHIAYFAVVKLSALQGFQRIALRSLYGSGDFDVACISIELEEVRP